MADDNNNRFDWRTSQAKRILLEDLYIHKMIPLDRNELSARDAWDMVYSHLAEFRAMSYPMFREKLNYYRNRAIKEDTVAIVEDNALVHDRLLFPRRLVNSKNEIVFDLHPAKMLLRDDVENERHVNPTPSELQATQQAYLVFPKRKFKERIYQEVRYKKFVNHLNQERQKGRGW